MVSRFPDILFIITSKVVFMEFFFKYFLTVWKAKEKMQEAKYIPIFLSIFFIAIERAQSKQGHPLKLSLTHQPY